jgi:NAD(P)-dependent dehydrogenase (short-subunit alcohol dehydrogenase family)
VTGWTLDEMPDQTGRSVLITGATGGLGQHVAQEFARRGARVVLAARSKDKLDATEQQLKRSVPDADLHQLVVDLADLSKVRLAADTAAGLGPIDVLVNNAGVMATPEQRTVDGLDLQMATNHFGHFLLTGQLLPQLVASGSGRVVTVSSNAHRMARTPPLDDPRHQPGRYSRWRAYGETKLANLLFTYELERRARAKDLTLHALAAHPGYAATHLLATGQTGRSGGGAASILNATMRATGQPARMGALPILMAATADLPGGTYCGPGGFHGWRGLPEVVTSNRLSRDEAAQTRLWEISEATTGMRYP